MAGLYRHRVPVPNVARIVENMLGDEGPSGNGEGSSSGIVAGDNQRLLLPPTTLRLCYETRDDGLCGQLILVP